MTKQTPFEYSQFLNLVKESYNSKSDIVVKSKEITNDVNMIISTIEKAYPLVENKNTKAKLTRLKNKLLKPNIVELSTSESYDMEIDAELSDSSININQENK